MTSTVSRTPAASPLDATQYFSNRLAFETDCWDVHHAIDNGKKDFVLLDVRSEDLFESGHVPTATSLPHWKINEGTLEQYPLDTLFVVYCAGPHCNGAHKGALALANLGRPVKEMIGGAIGWTDEGFQLETSNEHSAAHNMSADNMRNEIRTFIVDSFTNEAFKGNPAGVCLSEELIDATEMQLIARELNFSETAFIVKLAGEHRYSIRYFSPKMEIPLCGHATLAAAKVLFDSQAFDVVEFTTAERLNLRVREFSGKIEMEFPIYDLTPSTAPLALLNALGIESCKYCGYNKDTKILMLEIDSADELRQLCPDFPALQESHDSINGVLVTSKAADNFDFHSRYFWPWSGSNEDPVTGGTHTFLAKYWSKILGKSKMRSYQASHRSGQMEVELTENNKLLIRGDAIIVFEGFLRT